MTGKLISFEGLDRCGKTTQIKKTVDYLTDHKIEHIVSREPGGTTLGEVLRQLLKHSRDVYGICNQHLAGNADFSPVNPDQLRSAEAEVLLFLAARAEYAKHVLRPALEGGLLILSDRLCDSTRAYQGGGLYKSDPVQVGFINQMNRFALGRLWPHKTVLLDISVVTLRARKGQQEDDAFEQRDRPYFERVRDEYLKIAREEPHRVIVVNAERSPDEVFADIVPVLEALLNKTNS